MVSGSNVTSVWIGPIPNTALYGIDINEWIDFISTVLGGKKGRYPSSNLLKEDIDKWMLIDLPKGVDSIISREEYRSQGSMLPFSWVDFRHLVLVLGKNHRWFRIWTVNPGLLSWANHWLKRKLFISLWFDPVHSHTTVGKNK